jgi:hypothetical protein
MGVVLLGTCGVACRLKVMTGAVHHRAMQCLCEAGSKHGPGALRPCGVGWCSAAGNTTGKCVQSPM